MGVWGLFGSASAPGACGKNDEGRDTGLRYLKRRKKPRVAHVWTGTDTACRMASTGGLAMRKYEVSGRMDGLRFCEMCKNRVERGEA